MFKTETQLIENVINLLCITKSPRCFSKMCFVVTQEIENSKKVQKTHKIFA